MLLYVSFNLLGFFKISLAHTECLIAKNNQFIEKWITESQNHRIVGIGRDLCGSSSPELWILNDVLSIFCKNLLVVIYECVNSACCNHSFK